MKHIRWQILLGVSLIALSAIVYLIHYALFRDAYHIFNRLIGDIAFVFIEVLLVTLIIHKVLALREKQIIMERLNMVIGSFFSVVGKDLLRFFSGFDPNTEKIRRDLIITNRWSARQFLDMSKRLKGYDYAISIRGGDLGPLKEKLVKEREFMMRLLENQNLLEHDAFTGLLMAVFHLAEELESRPDINNLTGIDLKHIAADMQRAYSLLISEWLSYMNHLRENFPYLFSFAMRTNPFDPNASPEVKE
ncbi:MAG TPA: hypothetical protein VLZ07_13120 [Syntrophales bacterium]|nr:hypothetical protein [Syntrophales bacterium]